MTSERSVTPDADRSSRPPDKPSSPSLECRQETSTTYSIPMVTRNNGSGGMERKDGDADGDGEMEMGTSGDVGGVLLDLLKNERIHHHHVGHRGTSLRS